MLILTFTIVITLHSKFDRGILESLHQALVGQLLVCLHTMFKGCGANHFHISHVIKMKLDLCHLYEE